MKLQAFVEPVHKDFNWFQESVLTKFLTVGFMILLVVLYVMLAIGLMDVVVKSETVKLLEVTEGAKNVKQDTK